MRIVQLTDLHLPPLGADTQLGIDTRRNFLDMLPRAVALQPDLLVLSGDLCYDIPDTATFTWVREQMDAQSIPYAVIAGNHDDSSLLGAAFGLAIRQKEVYFVQPVGRQPVLFLDTALATSSDTQLAWLEEQMTTWQGPVLLFMHHPPV
ncbi:MAG: metallophosphoesterase, partial [Saprospiraceae bacterium]